MLRRLNAVRDHTDDHADYGADAAGDPEHGQDPWEHDVREEAPRAGDHDREAEEASRLVLIVGRGRSRRVEAGLVVLGVVRASVGRLTAYTDCPIREWLRASGDVPGY